MRIVVRSVLPLFCAAAFAQDPPSPLPADGDSYKGDTAYLNVTVPAFRLTSDSKVVRCAPTGSQAYVSNESSGTLFVRFDQVTDESDTVLFARHKASLEDCRKEDRVKLGTGYSIARTELEKFDHLRTGVSFGGLVIPFKYRLGEEKELVSSPAIAPFVGFRTRWLAAWGITFTPVAAAGLSLVPVPTADGKDTENKAAYTVALGFRISSNKNSNFTAGILYGRDFLGSRDTDLFPKLKKPWMSIYLGAAV